MSLIARSFSHCFQFRKGVFVAGTVLFVLVMVRIKTSFGAESGESSFGSMPNIESVFSNMGPDLSASVRPYEFKPITPMTGEFPKFPRNPKPESLPLFKLRGRIEFDTIGISQSASNVADFGNIPDIAALRRARIGAEGHFSPDSRYIGEIDLASGQIVIRDLLIGVGNVKESGEWKAGHMREPFSLEGATSSNTMPFMERSPINTLDPARNWGVAYTNCYDDEMATFAIGIFKSGANPNDFGIGNGSDSAVTAKMTRLLWYENDGADLLHLGFAESSRIPDQQIVVVSQRPNSPLLDLGDSTQDPFVAKLKIPASFQQLLNAQAAYQTGSFWAEAEWYGTLINQLNNQCVFLYGSYAAVGYFVTGEHRSYLRESGFFGPVTVKRPMFREFSLKSRPFEKGYGALELTARASYLNFSDNQIVTTSQTPFVGTTLPTFVLGANWYLADRFRIMFNYTCALPDESTTGRSVANVFGMRMAMYW